MKYLPLIVAIVLIASSACAASDVNLSISVGQPGFYGRIDIGNAPRPQVIYAKPVVVRHAPVQVVQEPVYVRVPPGHEKKWSKHCHKYNACDRPVYFVRDKWYNDVYAPHYHKNRDYYEHRHQGHGRGGGQGEGHGKGHGEGKGKSHGRDRD